MRNWKDKKVLVVGAARQGLASARYLSNQGAAVTLNDGRNASHFFEIVESLDRDIECHFGGHPISLLKEKDLICISGGVPLDIPMIAEAKKRGIRLTNDAQIFLLATDAKVIGITGSAGKTTTTTFIGAIAKAAVKTPNRVWVGGNIGFPLIDHLAEITENDCVVMELSSFQLELMTVSPHISVVLNITPNHLDRHKTMAAYIAAKAHIINFQKENDIVVLNRDDANAFDLRTEVTGELISFGHKKSSSSFPGTFIQNDQIWYSNGSDATMIMPVQNIMLPGKHNQMNALAACSAGIAAGFPLESLRSGIQQVDGIPHRLELIADKDGIRWYNDSIATAPERVIAAMHAIDGPLILLLGGRDKNLPWEPLAEVISRRQPKIILFGEAGEMIEEILRKDMVCGNAYQIDRFENLDNAVHRAAELATRNDIVLLSPGGTSYDAFTDFEERGEAFKDLVERIT